MADTFETTASSFGNTDFVEVVLHRYRFCFGAAAGDPALASFEGRLAEKPCVWFIHSVLRML